MPAMAPSLTRISLHDHLDAARAAFERGEGAVHGDGAAADDDRAAFERRFGRQKCVAVKGEFLAGNVEFVRAGKTLGHADGIV